MKETEIFEIAEAVFDLLPCQSAYICVTSNRIGQDRHRSNLVALVTDTPKHILFTLPNEASAPALHVGEACEIQIPDPSDKLQNCRALIRSTVHASIPCGTHTVYLADVLEARFAVSAG